ncbi:unnamed protein product [Clonostachys rhizophaga]|uniref:Uncharacterized protein n=1 Tax=Clonostachys rhizophaga TaxID=160324 RepID=A0A9N9YLN7_9HYPO|nr:unnamed protein product [Clonostachys rhizophaga]
MDKKQTSPAPLQAELLSTQEEQVPANPPSRKRQIDSDNNVDDNPQLKRARLTRENLARFTKMGKGTKKISLSSPCDSTSESQKTKSTSTTTSGFAIQARRNGILDPSHSKPPANLKDIRERHSISRASVSPTESEYTRYARKVARVPNEATMVFEAGGRLLKGYDDDGYSRTLNQSFTRFPDVGFNDGLSAPQPDFIEGLEMEEYDPFPVDEQVDGAVLFKDNPSSLTLPHIAGEWKGPNGNMGKAMLQSSYDGAALVYARNQALSYMGRSDPPGHAEVVTFTTDGTTLNQYAHYAEELEDGITKYHQYRIKSTNLIDSYQEFKDGRRGLRNTQDHARDQSYILRDDLKEYWKQQRSKLQPITEGTSLPVPDLQAKPCENTNPYQAGYGTSAYKETATYEDSAENEVADQPHSTPQPSSKHSSSKQSWSKSPDQAPSSNGHKRKASQPSPLGSGHASKHVASTRTTGSQTTGVEVVP